MHLEKELATAKQRNDAFSALISERARETKAEKKQLRDFLAKVEAAQLQASKKTQQEQPPYYLTRERPQELVSS